MKAITAGHLYELESFEGTNTQTLQFIQKEANGVGEFLTVEDGTTNEEVLAVLIDRMQFLNAKAACRENSIAITKLQEALFWLNERTRWRVARGVEGTPKP